MTFLPNSNKSSLQVVDEPVYKSELQANMAAYGWTLGGNSLSGIQAFGTITNHEIPVIVFNNERARFGVNTAFTTISSDATSGTYSLRATNIGGVNLFVVKGDGWVGINTTTPYFFEKLRVNGSIYCDSDIQIIGALKLNASGFTAISYGGVSSNEVHITGQGGVSMYDAGGSLVYFKYIKAINDGDNLEMLRAFVKSKIAGLIDTSYYFAINVSGTPNSFAVFQVDSTDRGFLPPRQTTAQRTGMALGATEKGMVVFDTDLNQLAYWTGAAWTLL